MPIWGAKLQVMGDNAEAPHTIGTEEGKDLGDATRRLQTLLARLHAAGQAGLQKHVAAALVRAYSGASSQYPLRLGA